MLNAHARDPCPALRPWSRPDWLLLAGLVALKLALHAYEDPAYGYFRDELYYLICAQHLDWGYVDFAPLAAIYARVAILLGGSLFVVHAIPALAGAGLVALSIGMARELGGGRFAMGLTGVAVLVAPVNLVNGSQLSMNVFEPLYWMGSIWVLMRYARTGDARWWLALGFFAGLGLENKHSTLFFGAAVVAGLVLSPQRRAFRSPWLWAGGGLAALIFLPNAIWQVRHGFPTIEDLRNVRTYGKNVPLSPLAYLGRQVLMLQPVLLPLWLSGLWHFLAGRGTRLRVLGWAYLTLLAIMIALKGKDYYLAPIYPMLFAGGAVAQEAAFARWFRPHVDLGVRVAIFALVILASIPATLTVLPVLPPAKWPVVANVFGIGISRSETSESSALPQFLADRTGWEQLTAEVATVYRSLTPDEQRHTTILAGNYGGASAINWFGARYGLPSAVSGHQSYFYWGPSDRPANILISVDRQRLPGFLQCDSIAEAAHHTNPWGMGWEDRPILLCRGLHTPLPEVWPKLKYWN